MSCDSHRVSPKDIASQHSCGSYTDVWETLGSLVTDGVQLQDSNILTGLWKEVDLPSFAFITFVFHKL